MPSAIRTVNKKVTKALIEYIEGRSMRDGDCYIWQGAHTAVGYGNVKWKGVNFATHRAMYEWEYGKIPKNRWVRHTCGKRDCINAEHLYLSKQGRLVGS